MIAIGYTRRSKKSEAETLSLKTQREHIADYCTRKGFDLVHVVEDDGVSGTKRARFAGLDAAVKKFHAGCVVYYNQDRMARDVGVGDYFKTLARRGVEVHETSGGGKVDIKSADGRMVVNIRASVDAAYAEKIGEKTADALKILRDDKARYSNIPPLGYLYLDGQMIADAEEQHALEVLKKCRAAGLGARRALRVLEAGGYTGRKSLNVIHKALKREDV